MNEERFYFPYIRDARNKITTFDDIQSVFDRITDDESKHIFTNRLNYSMTSDFGYIRDIVDNTIGGECLREDLEKFSQKLLFLYGVGIRGRRLLKSYPEVKWSGLIDRNEKCFLDGYEIINDIPEIEVDQTYVLVSNMFQVDEIISFLGERGIDEKHVLVLNDYDRLSRKDQYFDKRCIGNLEKIESFVDCGCFDGEDSLRFIEQCRNIKPKVYAFEPDPDNYQRCVSVFKGVEGIELYNVGCYRKNQKSYIAGNGVASNVVDGTIEGYKTEINLGKLDDLLKEKEIDYIKMDVEGAEMDAIIGAAELIREQKPRLAISVYHRRDDVINIPKVLLELNPQYCFSFGHYSACLMDTVLYAV